MNPTRSHAIGRALTWVEIDSAALVANHKAFRQRLGPTVELAHAVKANAYGHGLELVAREDEASGVVDRLAVISVDELLRLRRMHVKLPVLILGYVPLAAWPDVVEAEGTPIVSNRESLVELSRISAARGRDVNVHLKVETGTHRYGLAKRELLEQAELITGLPGIRLEGVGTHFANIEDTTDHGYAREQMKAFASLLAELRAKGHDIPVPHTACSAAAILFPESHYAMARVGISSYGIWPSKETRVSASHTPGVDFDLHPVLTWKTRVAQVKTVPEGAFVGYGCSWRATSETRLAILPLGYADGYDRRLSNVGHVLVGGKRAPIRGRVCMNVTMVDVTHHPEAVLEEEVVLLGAQGQERISAEDMAGWCSTIPYEILARIPEQLPRVRVERRS